MPKTHLDVRPACKPFVGHFSRHSCERLDHFVKIWMRQDCLFRLSVEVLKLAISHFLSSETPH